LTRLLSLSPSPILPLAHSLGVNSIGDKGVTALATILNETKITNLKCAAASEVFAAPVDTSSAVLAVLVTTDLAL
tara:strand:+ start:749 stop:973 length:225 start_codon:yes stop_codon:yes gene_type:complete